MLVSVCNGAFCCPGDFKKFTSKAMMQRKTVCWILRYNKIAMARITNPRQLWVNFFIKMKEENSRSSDY